MCYSWKCREIIGVGLKTDEHNTCYKEQQQTTYHCHYSGSLFSHHNSISSKVLSHLSTSFGYATTSLCSTWYSHLVHHPLLGCQSFAHPVSVTLTAPSSALYG